jgi:hypothetical protein
MIEVMLSHSLLLTKNEEVRKFASQLYCFKVQTCETFHCHLFILSIVFKFEYERSSNSSSKLPKLCKSEIVIVLLNFNAYDRGVR